MRRFPFSLTVAVALVAAIAAMGMGVGLVAADDTNATATNETDDGLEAINASDIEQTIDSQTVITDWSFEDSQFRVEFYAEEATTLTVAESGSFEEGSGEFAYYTRDLPAGTSVETFRVVDPNGAALSMATPLAEQEERGAYISTGRPETGESDPFRHFGGESGLFSGVAMTVGLAVCGTAIVLRQEESGVIEA